GDAHFLAGAHAGRDLHIHLASRALPAGTVAGRTRLAADVAATLAGAAGLVQLQRERLARALERLLQRNLDSGLHVFTAASLRAASEAAPEHILEAAATEPRPTATGAAGAAHAGSEVAEDRA